MIPWLIACTAPPAVPREAGLLSAEQVHLALADGVIVQAAKATVGEGGAQVDLTQVQATSPGPPPLEITAPSSTWDLRAHTAHFEGGVRAVRGGFVLTADVLDVAYAATDRVDRAVATGRVRVERDERLATGERAELFASTGKVVLTGSPTIREGASQLTGTEIVLWLDDEKVDCRQCRLVIDGRAIEARPPADD